MASRIPTIFVVLIPTSIPITIPIIFKLFTKTMISKKKPKQSSLYNIKKNRNLSSKRLRLIYKIRLHLIYFLNDSLESLRIVYSEVSKNLTVNLDTSLVQSTHKC